MSYVIEFRDYDAWLPHYNEDGDQMEFSNEEDACKYCQDKSTSIIHYRYSEV